MRKIFLSMIAAAVAVTTACGGDSSIGPSSAAGTYSLQTVNSKALPFIAYDDGTYKIEVISDSYTLSAGGTYTNQTVIRNTTGGTSSNETINSDGKYTVSGSSVTLTDSSDPTDTVSGTVNATGMTISVDGAVLVYSRS